MQYEMRVPWLDDVIVFSDELEALQRANEVNKQYLQDHMTNPDSEVLCVATVHEVDDDEQFRPARAHSYAGGLKITTENRINEALESVLKASGSSIRHFTMTPLEMAGAAAEALAAGTNMTLVRGRGVKIPPKFPRGELLCENFDGTRCYSYDPFKVLAWLSAMRLVKVTATAVPNA